MALHIGVQGLALSVRIEPTGEQEAAGAEAAVEQLQQQGDGEMLRARQARLRVQPVLKLIEYHQAKLRALLQEIAQHHHQIRGRHAPELGQSYSSGLAEGSADLGQASGLLKREPEGAGQKGTLAGLALLFC